MSNIGEYNCIDRSVTFNGTKYYADYNQPQIIQHRHKCGCHKAKELWNSYTEFCIPICNAAGETKEADAQEFGMCVICKLEFTSDNKCVKSCNCCHMFHYDCWKNITYNYNCPTCHKKWKKTNYDNDVFDLNIVNNDELLCISVQKQMKLSELTTVLNLNKHEILVCNKKQLIDDLTLDELHITSDTVLSICSCRNSNHSTVWKTTLVYNETKNQLTFNSSDTFIEFKKRVQNLLNIPFDQQEYVLSSMDDIDDNSEITLTQSMGTFVVDFYSDEYKITRDSQQDVKYWNLRRFNSATFDSDFDDFAFSDMFINSLAWQPVCEQSLRGMSNTLSCLYVMANYLSNFPEKINNVTGFIRILTQSAPISLSFKLLFNKRTSLFRDHHKANISNGLFMITKRLLEDANIEDSKIFEYSRYTLSHLLYESKSIFSQTETFVGHVIRKSDEYVADDNLGNEQISEELKTALSSEYHYVKPNTYVPLWIPNTKEIVILHKKWKNIVADVKNEKIFTIVKADSLNKAKSHSLTLDETGNVVVFTGRGKSQQCDIKLFCPLAGEEIYVSPKNLDEKIKLLPSDIINQASELIGDNVKPEELVMICFDTSSSMGEKTGFLNENDDTENLVKMVRETKDEDKFKWDVISDENDESIMSSREKLSKHLNFELIKKILWRMPPSRTKETFVSLFIYEYYCGDQKLAETIMANAKYFYDWMIAQKKMLKAASIFSNGIVFNEEKPACPVTGKETRDPRKTDHGNVYDREMISSWLRYKDTDPITGIELESKKLTKVECKIEQVQLIDENNKKPIDEDSKEQKELQLINIFIKTLLGTTHTVECQETDTINSLVDKLSIKANIGRDRIRLIFAGKMIQGNSTLKSENIRDQTVLHMVLRDISEKDETQKSKYKMFLLKIKTSYDTHLMEFFVNSSMRVSSLKLHILNTMIANHSYYGNYDEVLPYNFRLAYGREDIGDGWISRSLLREDGCLYQLPLECKNDNKYNESVVYIENWNHKKEPVNTELTRLTTVKQLFHAFINRSQAYDFPVQLGLITFSSEVKYVCPLTALYDEFRDHIDDVEGRGDTKLYDALNLAQEKLIDAKKVWKNKGQDVKLRILVLSDGNDTKSSENEFKIAKLLASNNIVCDSIIIGSDINDDLRAISKVTNGYSFHPYKLQDALKLNELEVMLFSDQRPKTKPTDNSIITQFSFNKYKSSYRYPFDKCDDENQPIHKCQEKKIVRKSCTIPVVEHDEFENAKINNRSKRIMREMKHLILENHPAMDVYMSDNDLNEWKIIIEGPDSTPYKGGTWLITCTFPNGYPLFPPEIRFNTEIKHCNINSYGRVCHSILDKNYTEDISIKTIFNCIYGLLLNPDVEDPLDSVLALSFFQANGDYEANIMKWVEKFAKKTRKEWKDFLVSDKQEKIYTQVK